MFVVWAMWWFWSGFIHWGLKWTIFQKRNWYKVILNCQDVSLCHKRMCTCNRRSERGIMRQRCRFPNHLRTTEFNQHFQGFAPTEIDINLLSDVFSPPAVFAVTFTRETSRFHRMRYHAKGMLNLAVSTWICEQTFSLRKLKKIKLTSKTADSRLCYLISQQFFSPRLSIAFAIRNYICQWEKVPAIKSSYCRIKRRASCKILFV